MTLWLLFTLFGLSNKARSIELDQFDPEQSYFSIKSNKFSGSFNELQIDEDDSLIDISIISHQNDILNDLKEKINLNLSDTQRNIKQTNEQRMNDIISDKLKKLR